MLISFVFVLVLWFVIWFDDLVLGFLIVLLFLSVLLFLVLI